MLFVVGFYFVVVFVGRGDFILGNVFMIFYVVLSVFKSIEILGFEWLILVKGMQVVQLFKNVVGEEVNEEFDKNNGWKKFLSCMGDIKMMNVSFVYFFNLIKMVFELLMFYFFEGEFIFVVGRSGFGKSMLGNFLLRFYEFIDGCIIVDGYDVMIFDLEWLCCNVIFIQQLSILFNDIFVKNVVFGVIELDKVFFEVIQYVCGMVFFQFIIMGMFDGINMQFGFGGYNFSGG